MSLLLASLYFVSTAQRRPRGQTDKSRRQSVLGVKGSCECCLQPSQPGLGDLPRHLKSFSVLLRKESPSQPSPARHGSHLLFCKLNFLSLSSVCRLVPFHLTPSVISSVFTHLVGRAHVTRLEGPQPGSVSCPQYPSKGDGGKQQDGRVIHCGHMGRGTWDPETPQGCFWGS